MPPTKKDRGIEALTELLVKEYGFTQQLVNTLVLKHPQVLGKSQASIKYFFEYLKGSKGIDEYTSMKLLFDVPVLLSTDVRQKSREIEELFKIYHDISKEQVTEIFQAFPYLYCCPSKKIQTFLAEFRKYRLSQDEIMHLVSTQQLIDSPTN